jgi:hypothetical protein
VLQIFPFAVWLAAITSALLLTVLWSFGELNRPSLGVLLGWFLLAVYCQFFAGSAVLGPIGLLLQTMLAIYLIFRWRFS